MSLTDLIQKLAIIIPLTFGPASATKCESDSASDGNQQCTIDSPCTETVCDDGKDNDDDYYLDNSNPTKTRIYKNIDEEDVDCRVPVPINSKGDYAILVKQYGTNDLNNWYAHNDKLTGNDVCSGETSKGWLEGGSECIRVEQNSGETGSSWSELANHCTVPFSKYLYISEKWRYRVICNIL